MTGIKGGKVDYEVMERRKRKAEILRKTEICKERSKINLKVAKSEWEVFLNEV